MSVKDGAMAAADGSREERRVHISSRIDKHVKETRASAIVGRPDWQRFVAAYILLLLLLAGVERASFALARIPFHLTIGPNVGTFELDGTSLLISWAAKVNADTGQVSAAPTGVVFIYSSLLTRELQIDGTDSINNFTEDGAYLRRIANSPYYQFQAAMRGNDTYSAWHDITAHNLSTHRQIHLTYAANGIRVAFPPRSAVEMTGTLERPETSAQILLLCADIPCGEGLINRNDRFIAFHMLLANGSIGEERKAFFPNQQRPFLAEVINDLARTALWSLALIGLLASLQITGMLLLGLARKPDKTSRSRHHPRTGYNTAWSRVTKQGSLAHYGQIPLSISLKKAQFTARLRSIDLVTGITILASFTFTLCIALSQYSGYPHILDASAYYFQAKIFTSGRLSAPVPHTLAAFQGPFMVASGGRWFAQYAPMTSLLLAVGMLLHVPWLIEPLLSAAALWGIYRIGCLTFSPFEGWLAVLLATLSPFYIFLTPSYLSHIPALFFAVYFLLALLRFGRGQSSRDLLLAAVCLDGLLLTRELSAVIFAIIAIPYIAFIHREALQRRIGKRLPAVLAASALFCLGVLAYLLYNWLQTGDALTTPRILFSPSDRYGFGDEIGFYGRHTLAAGFVNIDQLLTALQIDLYGWPFNLTLAFVPCAFLRIFHRHHEGRGSVSEVRWDTLTLLTLCALVAAQVGYFYHGIFLGPRYLFETLPFLVLLTSRGITALTTSLAGLARSLARQFTALKPDTAVMISRGLVGMTLLVLLMCNLVYFMPRQLELHTNFTGLPSYKPVDTRAVYAFHPPSSVIVTGDWGIYNYVVWPLNDPDLHGPTIYAYAPTPDALAQVRAIYPTRTFYTMSIASDGRVIFSRIAG